MERIIDIRGTGKTSKLFNLAKENNGIVVCSNSAIFREKAYSYGITGIDFITYSEFLENLENYKFRKVYIDELDQLAMRIPNIEGYTFSIDF